MNGEGTLDIQWALDHLASKADIEHINEAIDELKDNQLQQRNATHKLANAINTELALWRQITDARILTIEEERKKENEERRDHTRRKEDRRAKRIALIVGLLSPALLMISWAMGGVNWVLRLLSRIPKP